VGSHLQLKRIFYVLKTMHAQLATKEPNDESKKTTLSQESCQKVNKINKAQAKTEI